MVCDAIHDGDDYWIDRDGGGDGDVCRCRYYHLKSWNCHWRRASDGVLSFRCYAIDTS